MTYTQPYTVRIVTADGHTIDVPCQWRDEVIEIRAAALADGHRATIIALNQRTALELLATGKVISARPIPSPNPGE